MADQERIARLAKQIGSEIRREQHLLLTDDEVNLLRRKGAAELYSICADVAASINQLLNPPVLELTPLEYDPEMFHASSENLIQLNAQGRIVQFSIRSTPEKFSTQKFLTPYILEGEVRAYNQEMLERTQVRSEALFYCLEEGGNRWHYFEWLHGRTGAFGREQIVSLLEQLV
jgi:hypothetical protein